MTFPCFIQHSVRRCQRLHQPLHHAVGAGAGADAQRALCTLRPPRARKCFSYALPRRWPGHTHAHHVDDGLVWRKLSAHLSTVTGVSLLHSNIFIVQIKMPRARPQELMIINYLFFICGKPIQCAGVSLIGFIIWNKLQYFCSDIMTNACWEQFPES